jgi:hypothetical protein
MAVIKMNILTAMERFPDHKETITKLFRKDENFRILCEDYGRCAEALRHWNQSSSREAVERRQEYSALLEDLESEILENLDEFE